MEKDETIAMRFLLGDISSGLIHEFNNPLSTIAANTYILEKLILENPDLKDKEDFEDIADIIKRNSKQLLDMTASLKEFINMSVSKNLNMPDINIILDKAAGFAGIKKKQRIKIIKKYHDTLLSDRSIDKNISLNLVQFFTSLLLYGIDMIEGRGSIIISTSFTKRHITVIIKIVPDPSSSLINVPDSNLVFAENIIKSINSSSIVSLDVVKSVFTVDIINKDKNS